MEKVKRAIKLAMGTFKIIANWPNLKEMRQGIESVIEAIRR